MDFRLSCGRRSGALSVGALSSMERGPWAGVQRRIYRGYWSWLDLFPGGGGEGMAVGRVSTRAES